MTTGFSMGRRAFCTNGGGRADLHIVFARTERGERGSGISAFTVETSTNGLIVDEPNRMMGLRGSQTTTIHLENVTISKDRLIPPINESYRVFLYETAEQFSRLSPQENESELSAAIAKCLSTDVAMSVTSDALQIFGGRGYVRGNPVERMMRDAKAMQIFEGTNEIQRLIIGKCCEKPRRFQRLQAGEGNLEGD